MFLTSQTLDEASFYRNLLDDYRWTLRISSRLLYAVEFAIQKLDILLAHLDNVLPQDVVAKPSVVGDCKAEEPLSSVADAQQVSPGQPVDYIAMLDGDEGNMLWQQISSSTDHLIIAQGMHDDDSQHWQDPARIES